MLPYELTPSAAEDLKAIARYTLEQWGEKQCLRYAEMLEERFRSIAAGAVISKTFSKRFPKVLVNRCEHHYIFYLHPKGARPHILAVLHERMEMVARLKTRLQPE